MTSTAGGRVDFAGSICGECRVCLAIVNTAGYHDQNTLTNTLSRYESWRLLGGSYCCLYGVYGEIHGIVGVSFLGFRCIHMIPPFSLLHGTTSDTIREAVCLFSIVIIRLLGV